MGVGELVGGFGVEVRGSQGTCIGRVLALGKTVVEYGFARLV